MCSLLACEFDRCHSMRQQMEFPVLILQRAERDHRFRDTDGPEVSPTAHAAREPGASSLLVALLPDYRVWRCSLLPQG